MVVEKADKEDKDGVYRLVIPFFFFFFFSTFSHNTNKMRKEMTNLHVEEDLFLSL
jgi:hypothetical protein